MVSINYASREVCCKIVYYGPGLSGKTTNLQYVHSKIPSSTRGKMISLATESDRTLYFDFLPINIGTINGFAAKFQLYTVPGQVYYNATRKLVLRGVDGVVFVADSQPDKMDENIESLVNLEENLKEYGYDLNDLPMVIQYNKRDLPGVLPVDRLNAKLNVRGWPCFEASATLGTGVFDTLKLVIKMVLDKAKSSGGPTSRPAEAASLKPTAVTSSEPIAPTRSTPVKPPAAEEVSIAVQSEVTSAAAPATQAAQVAASEETAKSESYRYRPYPGSDGAGGREKKISPTTFTLAQKEEPFNVSLAQKVTKIDSTDKEDLPVKRGYPIMSPALRRRSKKKRGFFKRLFGIK